MKVGSIVKFIGFGGTSREPAWKGIGRIGIVVEVHELPMGEKRYTVVWPDGSRGNWLYSDSLEVLDEK